MVYKRHQATQHTLKPHTYNHHRQLNQNTINILRMTIHLLINIRLLLYHHQNIINFLKALTMVQLKQEIMVYPKEEITVQLKVLIMVQLKFLIMVHLKIANMAQRNRYNLLNTLITTNLAFHQKYKNWIQTNKHFHQVILEEIRYTHMKKINQVGEASMNPQEEHSHLNEVYNTIVMEVINMEQISIQVEILTHLLILWPNPYNNKANLHSKSNMDSMDISTKVMMEEPLLIIKMNNMNKDHIQRQFNNIYKSLVKYL